tara:strand:+ start:9023 stop:11830 length:2808 start_codon:yes stop_codon:yes gene_type:complete
MAVDILQQPTTPNVTGTNLVYTLSSSNAVMPQFRYVTDIYESGSGDYLTTIKTYTNLSLNAVLDVSRELGDRLEYDYNWDVTGSTQPIESVKTFDLRFGEEYAQSVSGSITLYTGSTPNYLEVFPGIWDISNGSFNFITSSANITLTNCPSTNDETFPTITEQALYFNAEDYATVTYRSDFDGDVKVNLSYYNNGQITFITSSDFTNVGDFNTIGIGPKNIVEQFPGFGTYVTGSFPPDELRVATSLGGNFSYMVNKGTICSNEYTHFAFINQYGFWDYYNIYNPVRKTTAVKRNQYKRPFVSYDNYIGTFDIENRGETQHYTELSDRYVTTTDYLTKETANWLQELFESPDVFIQQGTEFIPINITKSNYTVNNSTSRNKLFQYEIEYKMSNNTRVRKSVGQPRYGEVVTPTPTPSPTPTPTPTDTPTPTPTDTPTPTPTNTPTPTPTTPPATYYDITKINNIGSQNISGLTTQQIIDLQCTTCDGTSNGNGYKVLNVPMQVGDTLYDAILDPVTTYNGNLASNNTSPGGSVGACAGDSKLRVVYIYELTNGVVQSITGPQSTDCTVTPTPTPTPTSTPVTPTPTPTPTVVPSLTSFTTNATPEVSGASACLAGLGTTRYHDGALTYPEIGDTVYLGSTIGSGTLGAGFWGLVNGTYFETNISGVVTDVQLCPAVPTPTPTPTPAPGYNYYYAQPCGGGTTVYMRSVTTFTAGEVFKFAADSTCYEVGVDGAPINTNDWDTAFPDCSGCLPTPTPTGTPTPTPTPAPLGCYTYSVQNNDLGNTLTIAYNDCDGNPQTAVVLADSSSPDFCAEQNSVVRQSGTFSWVLTEEATTCTVVPATPTPTPTSTPTPTPTPVATCTSFTAGPNSNLLGVCEAIGANTYYHNGAGSYPIIGDTVYSNSGCSTFLAAGYYYMASGDYIRVVGSGEVLDVQPC